MKIGILTLPLHNNYGGNLQAYALIKYLKSCGHKPYLINVKVFPIYRTRIGEIKVRFQSFFKKFKPSSNMEFSKNTIESISENSIYFIDKYITPKTEVIYNKRDWKKCNDYNFDAIIVGSDQVWRKEYIGNNFCNYFLDFVRKKEVKKISYAASFGSDIWKFNSKQTNKIKKSLKLFDFVSVREDSAVEICYEHLGVQAEHGVDPTLLLNVDDYIKLFEFEKESISSGNCFYYILDETRLKIEIINDLSNTFNLTPFTVNASSKDPFDPIELRRYPSVTKWLRAFYDSKFIITDSFHGVVFSLIFNKPFLAIGNSERGLSRFTSLLNKVDLLDRLVDEKFTSANLPLKEIDWAIVNEKLNKSRISSSNLLSSYLYE